MRGEDGPVRAGDAVALVGGPVRQLLPHVVPVDDAVVRHACGASEHRHYVRTCAVFLGMRIGKFLNDKELLYNINR